MIFQLVEYDVWGNEEDGFFVNDVYPSILHFELDEEILEDDEKLIQFLKEKDVIDKSISQEEIEIDGDPYCTLFFTDKTNGCPSFEIRRID